MDRPLEKMHAESVVKLKQFLRDNNVSLKGLKVKAQYMYIEN